MRCVHIAYILKDIMLECLLVYLVHLPVDYSLRSTLLEALDTILTSSSVLRFHLVTVHQKATNNLIGDQSFIKWLELDYVPSTNHPWVCLESGAASGQEGTCARADAVQSACLSSSWSRSSAVRCHCFVSTSVVGSLLLWLVGAWRPQQTADRSLKHTRDLFSALSSLMSFFNGKQLKNCVRIWPQNHLLFLRLCECKSESCPSFFIRRMREAVVIQSIENGLRSSMHVSK